MNTVPKFMVMFMLFVLID